MSNLVILVIVYCIAFYAFVFCPLINMHKKNIRDLDQLEKYLRLIDRAFKTQLKIAKKIHYGERLNVTGLIDIGPGYYLTETIINGIPTRQKFRVEDL